MATAPKKAIVPQAEPPAEAPVEQTLPSIVESVAETAPPSASPPMAETAPPPASPPVAEIQEKVRAALEKGVSESRAAFAKAKASADEAANAFEQSFAAAKNGVVAINAKALEALRANAEANFDLMKATFRVKSLSDLVALQSEFARKQVEAMTGQAKDIGALTQKTVAEAYAPIKDQVAKSFKIAV
ncbi:MAG TPA: phasin family protein [Roseiarcus sp.]|nr:phasin family protein [Roseiarcus sp.]